MYSEDGMKITVAETKEFHSKIVGLLNEAERDAFIHHISDNPKAGVLLKGTGGIRKIRWQRSGMGKRGGIRVVYYYYNNDMPLYLLTVFSKNEKDNLSKAESNNLAKLAKLLVTHWFGGINDE